MNGVSTDASGSSASARRGAAMVPLVICGILPAALLVTTIAVPAAMWSRLPDRVADHWNLAGTADGTAPRLVPFLIFGLIALGGALLIWRGWAAALRAGAAGGAAITGPARFPAARRSTAAPVIGSGLLLMGVAASAAVLVTEANLGVSDWRAASIGAGGFVGVLGGSAALAAVAGYVLRRYGGAVAVDDRRSRPSLGLRAGERAVWTGRARARWAFPAGAVLLAAGVLVGSFTSQWLSAVPLLVVGLSMFQFTSVRVTVAARGVTVAYGVLGLRLTRFPLNRIERAEAVRWTAVSFGYRGSLSVLGGAAVVLRRGPALSLALRDGRTFVVTVDDAGTGAALLNDLIAAGRRHEMT